MPIIKNLDFKLAPEGLTFLGEKAFHNKFSSVSEQISEQRLSKLNLSPNTILLALPYITGIYRCVYCGHEAYLEKGKTVPPEHLEHRACPARMLVVGLDEKDNTFYCLEGNYYLSPEDKSAFTTPKVNTVPYTGIYKLLPTTRENMNIHPKFFHQGNKILPDKPSNSTFTHASWQLILATNAKMNENKKDGLTPQFTESCPALK